MKKLIALFVLGGTLPMLSPPGAPEVAYPPAPAAVVVSEPCPTCCPPEICSYNGPSFDGTTQPTAAER